MSPCDNRNVFLEFKDGFLCQGQLDAAGAPQPCAQYMPVSFLDGNILVVGDGGEAAHWEVNNDILILTFLDNDKKTPKEQISLTRHEK
ncbi:MAG: hypothetical protein A3B96_00655 [Candidatus Spechtbacteria bacterium RIFCSPHIGHO2_02_FULL_43_15b]|uniref:Uncharacterized protein n=1 Tax=Candidatus Spechtbacteria bacterium RIFCSPHIGHO2_01_FULL_43_30 TaxID=1802158 RepID=A0A1G2H6T2_9BACT|nr:MAG: hypothetical protein A2827_01635 [Candidatus Spechtbacteria bacterium RIFCSPHIGHO2_01_FULL_43_30]OGZ59965.1 MAG: hypothetical protein A3B96_00655 [Candidatus Spechtbacteria bacterium RIFCSPHIGHO2_02_FULL_43_15b]